MAEKNSSKRRAEQQEKEAEGLHINHKRKVDLEPWWLQTAILQTYLLSKEYMLLPLRER